MVGIIARMPTRRAAAVIAAALLVAAPLVTPGPASAVSGAGATCPSVAHRGDQTLGDGEESIEAYRAADNHGAGWLEGDLQVTKDQHLVLSHDNTLDRVTDGHGLIADKTAAQVTALHLRNREGVMTRERPITFGHLASMVANRQANLLIEVKSMGDATSWANLRAGVRAAGVSRTIVESYSPTRLGKVHKVLPNVRTALVVIDSHFTVDQIRARNAGALIMNAAYADDDYLASLGSLPVYVYTVDTPDGWEHFAHRVDGVFTEDVPGYEAARPVFCAAPSSP